MVCLEHGKCDTSTWSYTQPFNWWWAWEYHHFISEFLFKGFISSWWEFRGLAVFNISLSELQYLKWTVHPVSISYLSCCCDETPTRHKGRRIYFPFWSKCCLLFVLQQMKWCYPHLGWVFIAQLIRYRNSSQIRPPSCLPDPDISCQVVFQ